MSIPVAVWRKQSNIAGIVNGALELGIVVWIREWDLLPCVDVVAQTIVDIQPGYECSWAAIRCLSHDRRIPKLLDQGFLSLDCCVADFGTLRGLVSRPAGVLDVLDGTDESRRACEVDERVANVRTSFEINSEIDEVVVTEAVFVKQMLQINLPRWISLCGM